MPATRMKISSDSFLVYAFGLTFIVAPYKIVKGLEAFGGWLGRCGWFGRWLAV